VLACFNLVPGYPLDGGRVLRAMLWKATGSYIRATRIAAAWAGESVSVWSLSAACSLWPGIPLSPLWFVLVGSFLERLAYFSVYRLRASGDGRRVIDVMRRDFAVLSPTATLEEARAHFEGGAPAHLVADRGRVVGVISARPHGVGAGGGLARDQGRRR